MLPNSLSIIVPAFNEEGNIKATCEGVVSLAEKFLSDYEVLVFDDASVDRTGEILKNLQDANPRVIHIRNPTNRGLGYNYRTGVMRARYQYVTLVPGDNEVVADSLKEAFGKIGSADVIPCFASNPQVRHFSRRIISRIFTGSLNFLFGFKIKYYNGPCIIRTDLARKFVPDTASFAYMAVTLVRLLKSGFSYSEASFALQGRNTGSTKAFRLKNVISVIKDILKLFWNVQVCRSRQL